MKDLIDELELIEKMMPKSDHGKTPKKKKIDPERSQSQNVGSKSVAKNEKKPEG